MGRRIMEWAGRAEYLGGIPRALVVLAVGAFAKTVTSCLNSTSVHNPQALLHLVKFRPPGVPLLTVSNHMSTLDDPLMWGFKGFPSMDAKFARWVLAAEDICFKNKLFSYIFRLEGKVCQDKAPIRRLKWGTASLIVRAPITPIVLPIIHSGFEKVMPEKSFFGRRPPLPLCNKEIRIVIGEPIEFDLPSLKQEAIAATQDGCLQTLGWPKTFPDGLGEAAQRWIYTNISDRLRSVMESLRIFTSDKFNL
ncbi:N-acylphosphatidylethanolamine synthase-like isoform X2 [Musa acuminata AAA Group]|uniref:N-acylphosphatidylethanolamine synthase-like isoform X2 n=1 Tax=Musa acuminata AAA Group TaxID=214697 RepID=UPI0031D14736